MNPMEAKDPTAGAPTPAATTRRARWIARTLLALALAWSLAAIGCASGQPAKTAPATSTAPFDAGDIPAYAGDSSVVVNGDEPYFTDAELEEARRAAATGGFERYSALDGLDRCGPAIACVGRETMPRADRPDISEVHPTGWRQAEYPFVEGGMLYNRSHLIGYQLTAEGANERNLITGTRHMNADAMEPLESMAGDYVRETGNHVLYRVTPLFDGANLLASGVLMEARSVEDDGAGIRFCRFLHNVQPGVEIDYATGESRLLPEADVAASPNGQASPSSAGEPHEGDADAAGAAERPYVLNGNTRAFHLPTCPSVSDIKEGNKRFATESRAALIAEGFRPCGRCNP